MGKVRRKQQMRLEMRRKLFDGMDKDTQAAMTRPGSMNRHKGTGERAKR